MFERRKLPKRMLYSELRYTRANSVFYENSEPAFQEPKRCSGTARTWDLMAHSQLFNCSLQGRGGSVPGSPLGRRKVPTVLLQGQLISLILWADAPNRSAAPPSRAAPGPPSPRFALNDRNIITKLLDIRSIVKLWRCSQEVYHTAILGTPLSAPGLTCVMLQQWAKEARASHTRTGKAWGRDTQKICSPISKQVKFLS